MKKFMPTFLAAFVGTWVAFLIIGVVIFICGMIMLTSLSFSSINTGTIASVSNNSVLVLNLKGTITERPYSITWQDYLNDTEAPLNLYDIVRAIDNAATDSKISGIYIRCNAASSGLATSTAIRDALVKFKKDSGKWIYAYGDMIAQNDYYISSVADSIFMNPVGMLDIHGLTSGTMFFKGLLDKLGVEMQIIRVGTYKSAVEPFMLTSMSDASRLQTQTYINNIWGYLKKEMSVSRQLSATAVDDFANNLDTFKDPQVTVDEHFIDGLCYAHEFDDKLKAVCGLSDSDDLSLISVQQYCTTLKPSTNKSANKIAVLYACGEINVTGTAQGINSTDIVPEILELAKNDDIKGLVLRVNSPGGSAYASEQIWEALEMFKKEGKPFAVSMGDLAASGGYYISCGANRIFAEPTTLTGSIGIYGMVPSFEGLMTDKLGLTVDMVTTNKESDFTVYKPMTPTQRNAMQLNVNRGYELFTKRCADGRKMELDTLKSIAEGRVWDASDALRIGLIDEFGDVDSAVEWVATAADVQNDYTTEVYPKQEDDFMSLLYSVLYESSYKTQMKKEFGMLYEYMEEVRTLLNRDRLQCRMETTYIN